MAWIFSAARAVDERRRGASAALFIGDDWAEAHHDIEVVNEAGRVLARCRLPKGIEGIAKLHALVGDHLGEDDEPDQMLVGIETDRGPWAQALTAVGYIVYAINPLQVARYRQRHGTAGAKSDPGDAHVLPRSSAWIGPITGRSPLIPRWPSMSRSPRGRIRR